MNKKQKKKRLLKIEKEIKTENKIKNVEKIDKNLFHFGEKGAFFRKMHLILYSIWFNM